MDRKTLVYMDGGGYISFMCFFLIELCITSIYFSLTQFSRLLGYLLSPSHSHQFRLQLIKSLHSLDDFSNLLQLLFTSQTKKLVSNPQHRLHTCTIHVYVLPPLRRYFCIITQIIYCISDTCCIVLHYQLTVELTLL